MGTVGWTVAGLVVAAGLHWGPVLLAAWWTRRPPTARIDDLELGLYVERWHLVWAPDWLLGVVHRFHGRDRDPPHNHSGPSLTRVIQGEGLEVFYGPDGQPTHSRRLRTGRWYVRSQTAVHRLDPVGDVPLTTVFWLLPKAGALWGFWTDGGFVPAKDWLKRGGARKRFSWVRRGP